MENPIESQNPITPAPAINPTPVSGPSAAPTVSGQVNINPAGLITEKTYPITKRWVLKYPVLTFLFNVIALFFGYVYPVLALATLISLISTPIIRACFHYWLEDKFFTIKEGVFSKKNRHLPYGVIQGVYVKQDLYDRVFGIASLIVENASNNSQEELKAVAKRSLFGSAAQSETIGGSGNKISIPGLRKAHAEALKAIILQKIQENPIEDNQSGL